MSEQPDDKPPRARRGALYPGWIVVAGSLGLLLRETLHLTLNTDVFWHLAAGNWMIDHHAVLRTDLFSYTIHGRPWFTEEWGFEVLLAWMVRHVGATTYWLLSGGVTALALLVSAMRWRRQGAGALLAGAISIPVAAALFLGVAPRPQDLSYLFFALELAILTLARRDPRWLAVMPVLFVVWANIHGSFVAGLGVFVIAVILGFLANARPLTRGSVAGRLMNAPLAPRPAAAAFVVSALVTVANPHGIKLWAYAAKVTTSSQLNIIQEWQSPDFHSTVVAFAILVPIAIAIVVLAATPVRSELFDLVVFLGFLVAALHAIRFTPYFGIAFGGLAASWTPHPRETLRPTIFAWPLALLMCLVLLAGSHPPAGAVQKNAVPSGAATWLAKRSGRVFSTYAWNDYLISVHIPVFVDGRTDLYFGTGVLTTYVKVLNVTEAPDPVLSHWHVRWVLWPAHSSLTTFLEHDARWRLAKRFRTGVVFERRSDPSATAAAPGRAAAAG